MDLNELIKSKITALKMFDEYRNKDDFMIVKHIFEKELMRVMK